MEERHTLKNARLMLVAAFKAGIPILLGYTSIGFAFGLVLVGSGLPWWLSPLMAVTVFAGAAQFMSVGLIASGAGALEIAFLTLLMNARHMVYGLSVLDKYSAAGKGKPYLVFGLTDETYGLVTTVSPPAGLDPSMFYVTLTAMNQCWWVLGCTLGAVLGDAIPFQAAGIDFAMTALFVVLLVEQAKTIKRPEPYIAAAASALFAYVVSGPDNFIIVATALTCGLLFLLRGRIETLSDDNGKTAA